MTVLDVGLVVAERRDLQRPWMASFVRRSPPRQADGQSRSTPGKLDVSGHRGHEDGEKRDMAFPPRQEATFLIGTRALRTGTPVGVEWYPVSRSGCVRVGPWFSSLHTPLAWQRRGGETRIGRVSGQAPPETSGRLTGPAPKSGGGSWRAAGPGCWDTGHSAVGPKIRGALRPGRVGVTCSGETPVNAGRRSGSRLHG